MRAGTCAAVVLLTLAYVTLAGLAVHDGRFLHDEGLLTHLFASLVGREPAAAIFLQKLRPPLSLLYAPVAGAGLTAFLWAHVLVAALAVPLVAAAAQRLGHARPELAAAVVALSPMHVAAGASGLMNADAVVGVALVVLAWASGRWLAAGLVMGALVWVRSELAVLALVLAGAALVQRPWQWRALVGLAAFPLVYGLAGAVYHGDLSWMLHWPPALAAPMEGNPFWDSPSAQAALPTVAAVLAITPAVALLGPWRPAGAGAVERAGLAFAIAFVAALVLLPRWRIFNFDLSPRYLLPVLPILALAVSRVAMQTGREEGSTSGLRRGVGLGAFALLALAVERLGGGASMLVAAALASAAIALGGAGWPRLAHLVLGALLGAGALAYGEGARIATRQHSPGLDPMVEHLRAHPEWDGRVVYTNEPLLHAYLERTSASVPRLEVRYLVQADQLYELESLSNPHNGQRQALVSALRQGFYGTPVMPDALDPAAVPADAIFALREDPRLALVMPTAVWTPRLQVVHSAEGTTLAVLVPAGEGRR